MDSTVRVIFLGDAASAVRSVSTLEGRMGSLGGTAARTGKIVAGAFGVTLAGSIIKATSLAIGFDRSMRNVNSIAHLNEKQFQALSKQVLALGKVSGQAPKVLADGLYDIVSSGFKAKDALTILHASAIAATAGMTDTATASKGVVAVLNAYHLSAGQARNVSSLLFKEVQLGVNTFGELASQIGDTAPLAAQLKVPFSDVAAGLALITLHGTSMAEASTQMARVMTDLLKPSKGLSAELKSLGYENGQAAIQAHGFVPLIKQLSDAAGGSAVKTADWFQNIRSLRGMLNLTGPNLAKFNQFARETAKSMKQGGDDTRAFNEQSKSISVQWDKATASLSAAGIKLGTQLFPLLITGIDHLSTFAGWLDKLAQKPTIHAKFDFAVDSALSAAQSLRRQIDGILYGERNRRTQAGPVGDLRFDPGLVSKAQSAIAGMDWKSVGARIGAAIGSGIEITQEKLGKISRSIETWANGPGGHTAGVVGATIAANIVATLLDPGFWLQHWQLGLSIALAVMPVGRIAKIGEKFAELGFSLFGATAGKVVTRGLGQLPGRVGEFAPRFAAAMGKFIADAGETAVGAMIRLVGRILDALTSRLGKLGLLIKTLLIDGLISGIGAAIGAAYSWGLNFGENIAKGVLHGLEGLPGKIAAALIPGSAGTKYLPGSSGGTSSPRTNPKTANPKLRAAGGVISKPELAIIGEDAPRYAEFVIPTNPRYRERAMGLMAQAQGALGLRGFAAGGGPAHGHHYTGHQLRKRGPVNVKSVTGAAAAALSKLTAAQQTVSDLSRSYDQDVRAAATVQLPPLTIDVSDDPSDPTAGTHQVINPPGIAAAIGQLTAFVNEKGGILGALDTEKQRIEDAITAVQAAIDALLTAIAELQQKAKDAALEATRQHGLASDASLTVSRRGGLQDQVTKERQQKKPNRARINQLEAQIKQAGREHDSHESLAKASEVAQGRYQKQAQDDAGRLGDLRGSLGDLTQQKHDLPFDIRDQQIDVMELQRQITDVQNTTVAPFNPAAASTSSTGSSSPSGGASSVTSAIVQDLQARLQQYVVALGLQGQQLNVLGGMPSFERGTLHVPNDMVAQLHSGESVRTRDQTAADGRSSGGGGPITVHVYGAAVTDHIEAYVEQNGQKIAATVNAIQGRAADRLRRENRTA